MEPPPEAALVAVRHALAANDAELFAIRLAAAGLDEATLAACLAALAPPAGERPPTLAPRGGRLVVRAAPGWRRRVASGWREARPQLVDFAWKVGAALAAAAAAGLLGLDR